MEIFAFLVMAIVILVFICICNRLIAAWCGEQCTYYAPWFKGHERLYFFTWITFDMVLCIAFNIKVIDISIEVVNYVFA